MNKTLAYCCSLLIPVSAWSQSQAPLHDLSLTEDGSTLTATYDGTPLTVNTFVFSRTDWDVILGFTVQNLDPVDFPEPDGNGVNSIGNPVTSDDVSVGSDVSPFFGFRGSDPIIGTDPRDGGEIEATFTDLGDTGSVPDSQPTGPILLLSLLGMIAARTMVHRAGWRSKTPAAVAIL